MTGQGLPPKWSSVTAIFGGTFDPPHLGHLEAANDLLRTPGVKRVILMPAGDPPLKQAQTPSHHRLAMTSLLTQKHPEIEVSSFEIDRLAQNPNRPSYTADTLEALKPELGELAFVIGTDQLTQLPKWNRFPAVLKLAHWIVIERRGHENRLHAALEPLVSSQLLKPLADGKTFAIGSHGPTCLTIVRTSAREVSSTSLRESLERNQIASNLTEEVFHYLKTNRLYGTW